MTLANKLKTAFVNSTSWEDMEQIARDQFTEELYSAAADLFDPDTTLNLSHEYDRGVTELVMRVLGMDSDDKEDVAENISERTSTAHMLTARDFVEDAHGSLLYVGPLDPAVTFIKNNNEVDGPSRNLQTGKWTVKLDGGNVWGTSDTAEMAWRFAIGAEFGPLDEGFTPFRLK